MIADFFFRLENTILRSFLKSKVSDRFLIKSVEWDALLF